MNKTTTSAEILMIACLMAPFAYLALIWTQLPAEIATHYNLDGQANGWMQKETAALLMGAIAVSLYLIFRFLPGFDPKAKQQSTNFIKLRFVMTIGFAAITGILWYMAGHQADTQSLTTALLALAGLMVAGMGNYLTTVKPNYFIGIRTPWTLESETVWRKTHQMGGRLMMAGGLLGAAMVLVLPAPYRDGVFIAVVVLSSFIPLVYSYVLFQQEKKASLS